MTSPDGITWTAQTSAADNQWTSVTWGGPAGLGKFVAVANTGTRNRVMTSPDGITWTIQQTPPIDRSYRSVTWGGPAGNEKFVAVADGGSYTDVMTSACATPPTVTITRAGSGTLAQGGTDTVTFTLSEAATDFDASDVTVSANATLSSFSGSGTTYTATITPDADTAGTITIDVNADVFTDASGNNNIAATQLSIPFDTTPPDTTPPTVTITRAGSGTLAQGGTDTVTFTLSEAATDFDASDVTVSANATLSSFSGSGTTYTATITPDADTAGTITIDVNADVFTDASGNNNIAATQLSIPFSASESDESAESGEAGESSGSTGSGESGESGESSGSTESGESGESSTSAESGQSGESDSSESSEQSETTTTEPETASTTPTLVTEENQAALTATAGTTKMLVNGEEVELTLTSTGADDAGAVAPEERTAEQVAELQEAADGLIERIDEAAGGDSGLEVVDTDTGAEIDGIFDDTRVPVEDVIIAESTEFTGLYASRDEDGNPNQIRAEMLEMERGGEVAVFVYGLPAGEDAELVLMSTPYLLGTATADANGNFTRVLSPPEAVLAGDHTLVTVSDTLSVSLGIRITDPAVAVPAEAELPATGRGLPLAPVVLLIGVGALLVTFTRQRDRLGS